MFPKQWSSYTGKERRFRHLCVAKCLLRKFLATGALCRHTSDVLLRFRKHPHLEECPSRDYFSELNASLLEEMLLQGLFSQGRIIPARRNPPLGIIFPRRMHPCLEKSSAGDYFPEADASLPGEIHRWGLFPRGESISARRNAPLGIIFPDADASLPEEIHFQGLFFRAESIPARRIAPPGIISPRRKHPHVADRQ